MLPRHGGKRAEQAARRDGRAPHGTGTDALHPHARRLRRDHPGSERRGQPAVPGRGRHGDPLRPPSGRSALHCEKPRPPHGQPLDEEYEGLTEEAKEEIDDYVKDMRYRVSSNVINSGTLARRGMDVSDCVINNGYCTKCTASSDEDATSDGYRGVYYSVVTFVNVDIPILNKILPLGSWLQVSGETKAIYSPNGCPNY